MPSWRLLLAISSDTVGELPKAMLQIGEQWHSGQAHTAAQAVLDAIADALHDEGR